jgi:UDP-N-acetylglucosamine acyltransferase
MISGGSLVRKDVPFAAKEPLSYVGINSVGLRRGFTTEKIKEIQDIYRILYQKIITPHKR